MNKNFNDFLFSDDKNLLQVDRIHEMLSTTYWGDKRPREIMQTIIDNSVCFGIYKDDVQVGFARFVTDYAVLYYLADVVIDEKYRGQELGKTLIKFITEHEIIAGFTGFLNTRDAHSLYEQFGFYLDTATAMSTRRPNPSTPFSK